MSKKVSFSKPNAKKAEDWINAGVNTAQPITTKPIAVTDKIKKQTVQKVKEPSKRITLDVPQSWHAEIKMACAKKGVKMNEEILPVLQKHFSLKD